MKYGLLGLFLMLFSGLSFGQSKEVVSFSIPKTIYFGGEKVWIAGEVDQEGLEEKSIIFYAELLNRYNESVAIAKMPLENGKSFNFLVLLVLFYLWNGSRADFILEGHLGSHAIRSEFRQ